MAFIKNLTRTQFRIDHTSLQSRILILFGVLLAIIVPWYYLIYIPQSEKAEREQQQVGTLQNKTELVRAKYEAILSLAKNPETIKLFAKHAQIKKDIALLNQEITHYHHTYISDKELADLLHSLLKDMQTVSIENFSTKVIPPPVAVTTESGSSDTKSAPATVTPAIPATPTAKAVPAVPVQPKRPVLPALTAAHLPPEMTHYTLTLKGDYLSIMHFLQRIEALKWQLFWESLVYHVDSYPQGTATIEFYTLKPSPTPPLSIQEVAK
jgi:MSHA biogenesis protein MshJ